MADQPSLEVRCERLRSLHVPGDPLVLPNAWDVGTARAVVAAGFPLVATTSGGVAETLGHEDHEGAPGEEMLHAPSGSPAPSTSPSRPTPRPATGWS